MPSKEQLEPYVGSLAEAANNFQVSERTIRRWLSYYGLYQPRKNYGPNKLGVEKAKEMRQKFIDGISAKKLSDDFHVSLTCVYRTLGHKTYRKKEDTAKVFVIYNPS